MNITKRTLFIQKLINPVELPFLDKRVEASHKSRNYIKINYCFIFPKLERIKGTFAQILYDAS